MRACGNRGCREEICDNPLTIFIQIRLKITGKHYINML